MPLGPILSPDKRHTVLPGAEERVVKERPGLEFLDFLRTFLAEKLKIRTNLERRSSTVHSGYKTCALHCFHDRQEERKSAGIEKIKNNPMLRCWTPPSSAPGSTVH